MKCYDEDDELDSKDCPMFAGGQGHSPAQVRFYAIACSVCCVLLVLIAAAGAVAAVIGKAVEK